MVATMISRTIGTSGFSDRTEFSVTTVYVPTRRKRTKTADLSELKAAADRLSQALADVDEEEVVDEFKTLRRRGKGVDR